MNKIINWPAKNQRQWVFEYICALYTRYAGRKFLFYLLCLVFTLTLLQCVHSTTPVAGGSSSTDVGKCIISGNVIDSLNNPVPGSIVRLRPFDYTPLKKVSSEQTVLDVSTDSCGQYIFDSVHNGQYCIESIFQDTFGHANEYFIDSAETLVVLPSAKLIPMVTIVGKNIPLVSDSSVPPTVQTIGMEHTVTIDDSGNFVMRVPAGWTRLSFQGLDPSSKMYDSSALIYGKPGEKVELAQSVTGPKGPCDDLDCDLAAVREILDSAGLYSILPESVVTITDNRVSELHLRGKGAIKLCGSVGKLVSLRFLDIGKNKLDSISPSAFENLYLLETISADNNALRILPGSIGNLKALKTLNLSSNNLQSLPEPIIYLSLKSLSLDNNYLCDIGASTTKWADQYDPDWRKSQSCVTETQPDPNDPCTDIKCDMAVVKDILDSSYTYMSVAPESVVVISNNRVTELHLRSKAIKRLIPAINKLTSLRVLDIGNNFIDSLPSSGFERLYNLQEVIADSNFIRTFPISFIKLKIIRLNLSYNSIQSLPDQITNMYPSFLNLQYNILCNISESASQWADKFDPEWRWTQKCN